MLSIISCGIFEPRESEEPEKPVPWESYPIKKEQVLQNLVYSYNYTENRSNYAKIFTDDFTFYFASQDISEHSTPAEFNLAEESNMLMTLHKILGDYNKKIVIDTLSTIDGQDDLINTSSATLYRQYYIKIVKIGDVNENELRSYQGKAEFNLIQDQETSLWKMKSWKDYRTTTNKTWGLLKNEDNFE